jgi:His-Xaa-Ser system protein HxsD
MFGEAERSVEGERQLTVDTQIYGEEALFRACYAFTDRCYLFLRDRGQSSVTVVFRKRQSPRTLDVLVEDFANELISQRVRASLAAETKRIRELIVTQAFAEGDL